MATLKNGRCSRNGTSGDRIDRKKQGARAALVRRAKRRIALGVYPTELMLKIVTDRVLKQLDRGRSTRVMRP